ncbi:hypothetical protein [Pseudalkalibacillus berkeleyi]|uniref:Zinc ribbon domain-containing protein n=1 Tax=Pseudalkalibacillus berkeleyi TaxID=1069813 RepID=A0ABS9H5C7_9BACL|nr:hypothetical protein [Pseudalkalibacillus berkeleyi]MCF6138998.1 hypothetical protein [Pseudalkalibacillus berkeleyi]
MYCSNCGNPFQSNISFCDTCGAKRTATVDPSLNQRKRWHWLLPSLSFLIIVFSLAGYFYSEHYKTSAAIQDFKDGEKAALDGDYEKSRKKFESALEKRPLFPSAKENLKLVETAIQIRERLQISSNHMKEQEFEKASEQIQHAEDKLSAYNGKLPTQINQKIVSAKNSLVTSEIRRDMGGKSTLEDLEPLLTKADALKSPEAEEISKKIRSKIAEIAYAQANDFLTDHQFSAALASVKKGLYHEPKSKKLLSLKTTIHNEKVEFEQAEQKRIEQAIVAAAEEKEHNLNNAIELVSIKAKLNHLGDIEVSGTVKSKATVPLSSVSISYTLVDSKGKKYAENEVVIDSDILYPNESGTFEHKHHLVDQELKVTFNEARWRLSR